MRLRLACNSFLADLIALSASSALCRIKSSRIAFSSRTALREYPPQRGIVRIRSIDNALNEYNKKHKKQATIDDIEACIFSGKVFSYSYWDRTIVNYDELETELEEYLKNSRKC